MISLRGKECKPVSHHRLQKEGKEYAIYAIPNNYFPEQEDYQIMAANKFNPFNPYIDYVALDLQDAIHWISRKSKVESEESMQRSSTSADTEQPQAASGLSTFDFRLLEISG